MITLPMSNAEHDRLIEKVHRNQRMADAIHADLPRCKSIEERRGACAAIARYEIAAKEAHAELVQVRGW
jgi:hypothetical protein